jgi:hypothetical protein
MDVALIAAGLAAGIWLLIIVYRQNVRKQLPWFVSYVCWQVLQALIQLVALLFSRRLYITVYWWMEAVEIVLIVAAVRETFLRIFRGFTKMPWFRWTVSGVIATIVAYSAWKAIYHPPVQGNWLTSFIVGVEFLFRWGIAGIAVLTYVLSWELSEPSETREDAVMTGFGLISGAFILTVIWVSVFGNNLFFSKYAPPVGYFIAMFLWIRVFSRPVEGFGFEELGIGPEDMLKLIRRYRADVRKVRGKQ